MKGDKMSDYNPERGQVTAHIGKINAPGSWGVEKDENYFELKTKLWAVSTLPLHDDDWKRATVSKSFPNAKQIF